MKRQNGEYAWNGGWWLMLDMNAFFAACEQQDRPELRGRPVGIVPVVAETTSFIAASYEAKCFGIKTGTSVVEARQLCPHIAIVEARPQLYRLVHKRIIAAVETIVPVHEVLSVDEMTVRPWRNEAALPDALRLGQNLQDAIRKEVGEWLSCSIGLAPNAFLAKVASDLQKPRGLSVIAREDIPHKLYRLALTDWPGIARRMELRFHAAGVRTTEQMYRLSIPEMKRVFGGINGERWWRLIRGEAIELPPVRRWQIGHSSVLAPEYRTPSGAWAIACRLLEKACTRLRDEKFHTVRLSVSVESYAGQQWSRKMKFLPCNQTLSLLSLLKTLWEDSIQEPSRVSVSLQGLVPDKDVMVSLFDEDNAPRIDVAIDDLNRRFGQGTVTVTASLPAKEYLDHQRIPFGLPKELAPYHALMEA
ncbi:MAG: DNA polymerase [Akkermansiaceae bacterium]|nr:DNA polymerase [Armatimonadota bacterium]